LQFFRLDFSNLDNFYAPMPIGTLGNPNFNSVVLSFVGITCVWTLIYRCKNLPSKAFTSAYLISIFFLIFATKSAQGFWSLAVGCMVILYSHIQVSLSVRLKIGVVVTSIFGIFFLLSGMLSFGPLSKFGDLPAIKVRVYYWLSGICTGNESPLFGIGFDGYGDWYRRCRPNQAFMWNPNITPEASHNIYIDYYVTGGLILLLSFSLMIIATIRKIVLIYKGSGDSTTNVSLLVSIFVAFLAQGLISINQIGLAIWGWIFMGLILGYPIEGQVQEESRIEKNRNQKPARQQANPFVKTLAICLAIGITLVPPIKSAVKFKSAAEQTMLIKLESSLFDWPVDRSRVKLGIRIMIEFGQLDLAKRTIVEAVQVFPDDYSLWQTYREIFRGTDRESLAITELIRLDPRITIQGENPSQNE